MPAFFYVASKQSFFFACFLMESSRPFCSCLQSETVSNFFVGFPRCQRLFPALDVLSFFVYNSRLMENNSVQKDSIQTENKMGTMGIGRLLISMSVPMMLSMLVQALYNIVDSIYVSGIDEGALTAVSLAFPFQTLMISFAGGTAVGINALLSMRLGQKNQDAVNKTAVNGIFLALCEYAFFVAVCLISVEPYLKSQTQNPLIVEYGRTYLCICMLSGFGLFFGFTFDSLLRSTGRTFYAMITQLTGAITNIAFDPILIFGLGPFPKMGIAGAAVATVAGQILGASVSLCFNIRRNVEIKFRFKGFRPDVAVIGQIYKVGIPSIVLQAVGSVTTYGMNLILGTFKGMADTAIAVYGAYFKLNSFVFMPVFGLNNGMVPIVAYNYGARNPKRITKTIALSVLYAFCIMGVGMILFETVPAALFSLFHASDQMLSIGVPALRIIAPSFLGAALCIVLGSAFQALGKAVYSMVVSIARQLLLLLPSAYLLSLSGVIHNVWWCFDIAEILSLALSLFFFSRVYKKRIKPLSQGN